MNEYHISECCKADLFFKGAGKGFWCSKCKREITRTIVAFTKKEIKLLKELRDKNNPYYMKESTSIIVLLFLTLVIGQWIYLNGATDYGFPLGLGLSIAYLIGKYTK